MELKDIQYIKRSNKSIRKPSEMYICTYGANPNQEQKLKIKRQVIEDRYVMPNVEYEYNTSTVAAHGIFTEEEFESSILLPTKDNLKFIFSRTFEIDVFGEEELGVELLSEYLDENIDY